MSEPKTVATSVTEIVPGLYRYSIDDERIKTQSNAYALVTEGRVTLIDAVPLDPKVLAGLGKVEAVVIGTPSHQRCAWKYRREFKAKVYAPAGSTGLEEKPDVFFKAGDRLPGGLQALHAPGPADTHHVFRVDRGPGVLLCTDLWHVGGHGVEFLPEKYMQDAERARESARRLLEVPFDILCFGHGDPIMKGAKRVLSDQVRQDAQARGRK